MLNTKLCEIIGTKYPIIQGGMAWIADAELAAAVSNAGGLGLIAAANAPVDYVREQIRKAKSLTDKPFGVNVIMLSPYADEIAQLMIDEKVPVVTTGAGNPSKYISAWKEAGIKVLPVVPSVALAKRMERNGADAVIVEGTEAGGHIGEITTMCLVPQVADAVSIPVVAAGGIADARGILASFVLGASGVQMGTLFLSAEECNIHQNYKDMVVDAKDTDTIVTGRINGHPARSLKCRFTKKLAEAEISGKSKEELEEMMIGSLKKAVLDGNADEGTFMAGQIAGLIKEVKPASKIIESLVADTKKILENFK
ncbi:MAG: enoyl-[Oscillospiraceae bacterium]|nr:enoyl-[acyl-carrier-protein] reductase FabK [Oscillospiraceae bacterium]